MQLELSSLRRGWHPAATGAQRRGPMELELTLQRRGCGLAVHEAGSRNGEAESGTIYYLWVIVGRGDTARMMSPREEWCPCAPSAAWSSCSAHATEAP